MNFIKRILLGWRITLPFGERRIAIPIVLSGLLLCCCCPTAYIFGDVAVRQAGLAPTYTPRPTSTVVSTRAPQLTAIDQPTRALAPTATEPVDALTLPARAVETALTPEPPTVEPAASTTTPASERDAAPPADQPTTAPIPATPVPSPTDTAIPIPLPTATLVPIGPAATQNSNLRAGPGTNYPTVGSIRTGTPLDIVATNPTGDWYQLTSGAWIAASLVSSAPAGLPVAANIPPPPAPTAPPVRSGPTVPPSTEAGASNPNAFTCIGGCTEPPPGSQCVIKGNVNSSKERIYHLPGMRDYKRTNIRPEEGDRWFCTEAEAQAAGFRRAQR